MPLKFYLTILFWLCFFSIACNHRLPDDACECKSGCLRIIEVDGSNFSFYSSVDITKKENNGRIKNAAFLIHGLDYEPEEQFNIMQDAVKEASLCQNTIVVAPFYRNRAFGNHLYWQSAGWRIGYDSSGSGTKKSSFSIMDLLITNYLSTQHYPNLTNIMISGHSAGGQFAHRYGALNHLDDSLVDIQLVYLTANASSYLYVGEEREKENGDFETPSNQCNGDYDKYHYGLSDISSHPYKDGLSLTRSGIQSKFHMRKVIYFLGSLDTQDADNSCAAKTQTTQANGRGRFNRGSTMYAFMQAQYPNHLHEKIIANEVGHSSRDMFSSPETGELLERFFSRE